MGSVTRDQSHQIMFALMTNTDWDAIDFETAQLQESIVRNSQEAGRQFTLFLKNGGRVMIDNPAVLDCTKSLDIPTFVGQSWNIWKGLATGDGLSGDEEIDPRSLTLTTLDPTKLLFETCLRDKETSIKGEEKLKRLKGNPNLIRLGGNVFLALWEDYQQNKENSILEWLYHNKKVTYLDFFGIILRSPRGRRHVLCFYRGDGGRWRWRYRWRADAWCAGDLSASLASLLAESSAKAG